MEAEEEIITDGLRDVLRELIVPELRSMKASLDSICEDIRSRNHEIERRLRSLDSL